MMNNTPKYIYLQNKIKEDIKSGIITDKLPGERTLARELDISYMTVRKAIENLVHEGILHKVPTKGTYVNKTPKATTHNIGFFLDESIEESISSPYYSLVFKALEKEATKKGYNLIYISDLEELDPAKSIKKIDGLIVSCFPRIENKIQEVKKFIPVFLIDNSASDKSIPSVTIDGFNGIAESVNHLWQLGHRRIGFISGLQDSDVGRNRLEGYKSALATLGAKVDDKLIYAGDYSYESGARGAEHLLTRENPPTAIVCSNDSMAIGAIKAIREKGLDVPDDISVIGFDNIAVAAQVFPPLTTVAAPIDKLAEASISNIISLIEGDSLDYNHITLPATLTVRESTHPPLS